MRARRGKTAFRLRLLACLPALLITAPIAAQLLPGSGGAQGSVSQGGAEVRAEHRLDELRRATLNDDQARLLALLRSTAEDAALPPARREQVLFDYVQQLRGLPPGAAGEQVMAFLGSYAPRVLIPHEDHPGASVPRFNIRAAAAGVEHAWRRQEASYAGAVLLARDPARLVQAYRLHADPAIRLGLLDALDNASAGALEAVAFMALDNIELEPELADLAGTAALHTGDARALEQLLRTGSGAAIPRILRAARDTFDDGQLARLLEVAIGEAGAETAALAIAKLTPALARHSGTRARLIGLLGDPALGSAAALALAADPSAGTLGELTEVLSADPASLAGRRARLALEVMQAGLPEQGDP